MAYCYAELAVYSLAMAVIIASTHFAYPWRDGHAELLWVAGYIPRWFTRFADGHPSKYYPTGPALINFVDASNDVTN